MFRLEALAAFQKLDASTAIEEDNDAKGKDADLASERVLVTAWENAMKISTEGMLRAVPWDARRCVDADSQHQELFGSSLLDDIFKAELVGDSCYATVQSKSDLSTPGDAEKKCPADAEKRALLSGKPIHDCYVDRKLPGILNSHRRTGQPRNEEVWNRHAPEPMMGSMSFLELARNHPCDKPEDNYKNIKKSCAEYDSTRFQPIVTKAGSRLWTIAFSSPCKDGKTSVQSSTELRSSYPGQLLVRLDKGRGMVIYDCFEFTPISKDTLENTTDNDPINEDELKSIEKLLKFSEEKRYEHRRFFQNFANLLSGMSNQDEESSEEESEFLPSTEPLERRWKHIGVGKVHCLLNWIRFKSSRMFRIRFPVDSICGARVLIFDYKRPNVDSVPPPRGGRSGEDGTIEPLGVLVLEFAKEGIRPKKLKAMLASTVIWPPKRNLRKRIPLESDWTPDGAFSKSTRHYIIGDASEIKELANSLMEMSPKFKQFLSPLDESDVSSRTRKRQKMTSLNTLNGSVDELHPNHTRLVDLKSDNSENSDEGDDIDFNEEMGFSSKDEVHEFLRRCGVKDPQSANDCLKAGLLNGRIKVASDLKKAESAKEYLKTILLTGECDHCEGKISCTVGMALKQSEFGRYGNGPDRDAAVNCRGRDKCCDGTYITNLCNGNPRFTSGKFHNHCQKCPDFGICIGDYRNSHCNRCGDHFFEGNFGGLCPCVGSGDSESFLSDYNNDVDEGNGDSLFTAPPKYGCWRGYLHDNVNDADNGGAPTENAAASANQGTTNADMDEC